MALRGYNFSGQRSTWNLAICTRSVSEGFQEVELEVKLGCPCFFNSYRYSALFPVPWCCFLCFSTALLKKHGSDIYVSLDKGICKMTKDVTMKKRKNQWGDGCCSDSKDLLRAEPEIPRLHPYGNNWFSLSFFCSSYANMLPLKTALRPLSIGIM